MPLTDEQAAKVDAALEDRLNAMPCPVCRAEKLWHLLDDALVLPYLDIGARRVRYDTVQPVVAVVCTRCGYYLFFDAAQLGLIASEAPTP